MFEASRDDLLPAAKAIARMTIQALDSLPLPILVVAFLLLLILLQWPFSQPQSLLPTHSPDQSVQEKSRLSPLPFSSLQANHNPYAQSLAYGQPPSSASSSASSSPRGSGSPNVFYPVVDASSGRPVFVAIDAAGGGSGASSGARSPPRLSPGMGRRGSKHYWRGSLGGIEEEDEKRFAEA